MDSFGTISGRLSEDSHLNLASYQLAQTSVNPISQQVLDQLLAASGLYPENLLNLSRPVLTICGNFGIRVWSDLAANEGQQKCHKKLQPMMAAAV